MASSTTAQVQATPICAPYGHTDPDRLFPPNGADEWSYPEFKMKWYNDDDLLVFQQALHAQDTDQPMSSKATPSSVPAHLTPLNSAAPKRPKSSKPRKDIVREGWAYHISRWPLLTLIGLAFMFEFLIYISVRQIVRLFETLMSWRAHEGRLRRKLQAAQSYEEWKQAALELDELLGFEQWKRSSSNAYYDSSSVRKVVASLERSRLNHDVEALKGVLEVCLRANFAGVESMRLYSQTHLGTKQLIENYVDEVEKSLVYLRETPRISPQEKTVFFRRAAKNLGTTALCLSGGATFGFYHFGVLRALLDAGLIPTVITGTSAGALIAAFLCTHTDEELDRLLVPELADMITACEDPISVWLPRMFKTGARFDTVLWAKKSSFFTMGSMTFLEAYERTGRILNVSVIPHDVHSPTTLLNYITAPNCVIFSAILASAAVPFILNPVVLLEKSKDGKVRPWQFQGKHKDGSLRVDVPLESLHLYFNTSFSVVSQVNPHIHLFFFQPRGAPGQPVAHRRGKGWRGGFFMSALEQYMKIELIKNLRVIRDLELMPLLGGQTFTAVFLQRFEGTVTIWPHSRFRDWFNILTDPDRKELARMMEVGKRVTWPKIRMMSNRLRIERQVFQGRQETKRSQEATIPQAGSELLLLSSSSCGLNGGIVGRGEGSVDEGGTTSGGEMDQRLERYHEAVAATVDSDAEIHQQLMASPDTPGSLRQLRLIRDRRTLHRRLSQSSKSQAATVAVAAAAAANDDDDDDDPAPSSIEDNPPSLVRLRTRDPRGKQQRSDSDTDD
ncbi:hypothetical protein PCASD_05381 [Puccinia coronata f. sp. avenae]|uniref:Patatin-like phospholipase domain-containing protein n=1 Tax=Puccinia coronata f. sp. avenae TaxID=200324 RepID=A0A2N5S018_9BASI|nr:hypothetical protein PCASD_24353 [Puccinia coronata f. sp. avenae]PLW41652.1 hypothetical protein PCASD_05381 [Puccinia coronata f. sp. avenae]